MHVQRGVAQHRGNVVGQYPGGGLIIKACWHKPQTTFRCKRGFRRLKPRWTESPPTSLERQVALFREGGGSSCARLFLREDGGSDCLERAKSFDMVSPRIGHQGLYDTQTTRSGAPPVPKPGKPIDEETSHSDSAGAPLAPHLRNRSSQGPASPRSNNPLPTQAASPTTSKLQPTAKNFVSRFAPPCDDELIQFINQEVAKLPYLGSVQDLSRHVVNRLYVSRPARLFTCLTNSSGRFDCQSCKV